MKKHMFLAAMASLLAAAAIPSAFADSANGNDVVLPNGDLYQLGDDGAYHWIPDLATANAMKIAWNSLTPVDELDGPVGDPFAPVVVISNARVSTTAAAPAAPATPKVAVTPANGNDVITPDGSVYQLGDDGEYHLVPNVATGNAMHLAWNALTPVDELDGPVGDAFPSVA